jgi:hypothetical protein
MVIFSSRGHVPLTYSGPLRGERSLAGTRVCRTCARGAALVLRRTRHQEGSFFFFLGIITMLVGILGRKPGPTGGTPVKLNRSPENKKERMLAAKDIGGTSLNQKRTLS